MINELVIAEDFYSVQCEGHTTGYPAYFIRLKGCNLLCKSDKWVCDTIEVWKQGTGKPFSYLLRRWQEQHILSWILSGRIHLIWTGGEPSLEHHQTAFQQFIYWANANPVILENCNSRGEVGPNFYNEIETNGTIKLTNCTKKHLQQINCSAKLSNSGMPVDRRINPEAIASIMEHPNYWFKFVISTESDIWEINDTYVIPFKIPPERVIMMPGLDSRQNFHERTRFCLEMAKKFGFIGLTRLHVSAYDQVTGV